MFSNKKITTFTKSYWDKIEDAQEWLSQADRILIGAGSGLSASGGINYADKELAKKWFPRYYGMGLHTILDIQSVFWNISDENVLAYWGYWANHIQNIRYSSPVLKPYLDLFKLLEEKEYYICSTNVDGQFEKAGFPKEQIYAPQGDYALFQCSKPCTQDVYKNEEMVKTMLGHMDDSLEIRKEDIPRCPKCGRLLIPNLRKDYTFVEKPHLVNQQAYMDFINKSQKQNLVLLELGVGYNTPGIIRYPFEQITYKNKNAKLIRINLTCAAVPTEIESRSIGIEDDIGKALGDVLRVSDDSSPDNKQEQ